MTEILYLIKILLCTASFTLLCIAAMKLNLNPIDRAKQVLMPVIALVYGVVVLLLLSDIYKVIISVIQFLEENIPFISGLQLAQYMIYIVNACMVLGFLIIKAIVLPILNKRWDKNRELMEQTSGRFYEYDKELDRWFLQSKFGQVKYYYKGIYIAAVIASTVIFVLSQYFPKSVFFQTAFYPVFGVIVIGEVVCFLQGLTRREFVEDVLGEDEEAYRMANYGLLRDILKNLFEGHVRYDATMDNGLGIPPAFETLEEMCESSDPVVSNFGKYFRGVKESGKEIDPSYVKSCIRLIKGDSVLFCDPFYRDLTEYILLPMIGQLLRYKKCLIVMGRDSSAEDVKDWIEQGLLEAVNTDNLWKTEILSTETSEADIGILKFSDLFNFEIQKKNEELLKRTGLVFIIEPSKLLATGQMGLNLLVNRFSEEQKIVYAACDRNCDGLVDALSHTLKTNLTEVAATTQSGAITSMMCWDADGEYMHHRIFSNVSRYLGIGTEINAVAMKYHISNTKWISGDKFPVADMKWIAGQYYNKICGYTNLPSSQDSFNKAFQVDANLWNLKASENAFLVVEDEFQNLFEMIRLFATRAKQQGFINVISENYLLRDYMLENARTFLADPKAIPTIVADYARTERNTVLKLLMRMAGEQVPEEDIAEALMLSGISFENPITALKELIQKHCSISEINLRIYFKEVLLGDGFRTETKRFYAVEEETEIAEFARGLKNAYYIAEDEEGEKYYIGAKLYSHVFQALIPGQFLTFAGKYYEVESITPHSGVVVRRAADHITGRKYYRQIRHIALDDWNDDTNVGGSKSLGDIRLIKGYCRINVSTEGYLEMGAYHELKHARHIHVSKIPDRTYRNKLVLKVMLPEASDQIRYTICLLMNEIFRTTYPDAYPYICAVTELGDKTEIPEQMTYAMYTLKSEIADEGIYIIEDSEIDLGLIASVERNLERYFQMITEVLSWHDIKMKEQPEKKEPEEKTYYQQNCFLTYGYEEVNAFLDLAGTVSYLTQFGYNSNPLQQVRDNEKVAEEYAKSYDPNKTGAHFCDFCGEELQGGEYDVLKDGRERCGRCSATALKTGEQFKEVFKIVMRNMEIFYGIKINTAIRVRMTDANTIAKHFGEEFIPTPGPDGRVLGFAKKDVNGYSIYIENGSPKLAAMATIAHELTHIWQYQNWDDQMILSTYGEENRLEVYEGMAKWAEIQYLLYLNETAYGKREEIRTMLRQDEYGRGFIQYQKKYSLSYNQEKRRTPFQEIPPL